MESTYHTLGWGCFGIDAHFPGETLVGASQSLAAGTNAAFATDFFALCFLYVVLTGLLGFFGSVQITIDGIDQAFQIFFTRCLDFCGDQSFQVFV